MTRRTQRIIVVIAIFLVMAAIITLITERTNTRRNVAGSITVADKSVFINAHDIPAYSYDENIYIIAENLKFFGISVRHSGGTLVIEHKNSYFVETEEIDGALITLSDNTEITYPDYKITVGGSEVSGYAAGKYTIIPLNTVKVYGTLNYDGQSTYSCTLGDFTEVTPAPAETPAETSAENANAEPASKKIIVLDPGHGKSSQSMSDSEKEASGWVYNNTEGTWGEWRHFKSGTLWQDCGGDGCNHRITPNGACWYPIENGDRDTEPQINLNNCLAAKKYLEDMGYEVRLTRTSNDENPSITKRLMYCYPNNNTSVSPDAILFLCVHSNAGGGSGTSYIALEDSYDQNGVSDSYAEAGNLLGKYVNDEIAANTALDANSPISGMGALIAFCKSPVICGYLEIGFFDDTSDLEILNSSSDAIGQSIAVGVDKFVKEYLEN